MTLDLDPIPTATFGVVAAGWLVAGVAALFGKHPPQAETAKKAPASLVGIGFQMLAYTALWLLGRTHFSPIVPAGVAGKLVLGILACGLLIGSFWLAFAAIQTLGREWSFAARLVEGHRLVRSGPYAFVRHPIYLAMMGSMLATGIAWSHWIGLLSGLVLGAIGTAIRVRAEDRLLRESFGAEFDEYARQVGAVIPRLGRAPATTP
jgi:protein-S-isoprenylcysteine O-methyltransferase Ste14